MSNTQTVTIRQNTLTNRTIGKRLRFIPLERTVSSSVDRHTICSFVNCISLTLVSRAKMNGRLVPLVQMENLSVD